MTIPRREFLSYFVKVPVAAAILSSLGVEPDGSPRAPVEFFAETVGSDVMAEMTFETSCNIIDVTSAGDAYRRYIAGEAHYNINGASVTKEQFEAALKTVQEQQV